MCDPPPSKAQEGITTLPIPFDDDDDLLHVLDSDEEDQDQHDLGIEVEPHEILDPYADPIPNQWRRWKHAFSMVRVFGSKAWARIPLDKRKAFQF